MKYDLKVQDHYNSRTLCVVATLGTQAVAVIQRWPACTICMEQFSLGHFRWIFCHGNWRALLTMLPADWSIPTSHDPCPPVSMVKNMLWNPSISRLADLPYSCYTQVSLYTATCCVQQNWKIFHGRNLPCQIFLEYMCESLIVESTHIYFPICCTVVNVIAIRCYVLPVFLLKISCFTRFYPGNCSTGNSAPYMLQ